MAIKQVIPGTGEEQEVSERQYEASWDTAQGDAAYRAQHEPRPFSSLWDTVDKAWTGKLPAELIGQYYLRKIVTRCSACNFTSEQGVGVRKHIERSRESYELHAGAELLHQIQQVRDRPQAFHMCTGCGDLFPLRKQMGQRHLEQMREIGPLHKQATIQTVRRFVLGPSETGVLRQEAVAAVAVSSNGHQPEPGASQAERMLPKRPRGRRGRRSGRNGASRSG